MEDFTLRERLRYAFDNTLARGTIALIGWLALITLISIFLLAIFVVATGAHPEGDDSLGLGEAMWGNLMRTLDAGTMGGDTGWLFRIWMLLVTLVGIFILSTLIGVLSSGLEEQLDGLRKGRSRVVERGHTVILGWSEQVFTILGELIEANSSEKDACVVVLGAKDKVEMEDEIRDKVGDTKTTRVVCRSGSPIETFDLGIASIDSARSIVILGPDSDGEEGDVEVIKTLLAITNNPQRKKEPYHIVAEIRDPRNFEVAEMVGKSEAELVLVGDLIARIMAQTCRQSGLSVVYTELLDFGGDEIYFKDEGALVGKTYQEALFAYEKCSLIGIRPANGQPLLNPAMDRKIERGDRVIVIAADDAEVRLGATPKSPNTGAIVQAAPAAPKVERSLILGWNWRAAALINGLDEYVPHGSTIEVVAEHDDVGKALERDCANLKRQTLGFRAGDTTDRRLLDSLDVTRFDHVIVLCSDAVEAQKADAMTLMTLLHLRDISEKASRRVPIISEMLDVKNRTLAEVTRADDFIVSDRLVSLMLSQISQNKELNTVFRHLFSPEGSEIYLKPATEYLRPNVPVPFTTVVAAAAERNESAIGYKLGAHAGDAERQYGVVVNPFKSADVTLGPNDKVIVLSES
ncbi:MAG: potassium transporter TrkA [Deltaproteobacteria bacterium]|nr:potassium transporter TrkA [Deltaproteobacteria bacterium]